jgi:hypothetical protein
MDETYPPCRCCGASTSFPASRIQWRSWICSRCANRARDASPERYLARKFAEYLRRRGIEAPYPGVEFVRKLLERSGLSDSASLHQMRIVLKEPGLQPLVELEAVALVPARRQTSSGKTVGKW